MILVYGRIYLMTNLVNGKKYVGQTTYSLRVRFQRHFNNARHPGEKDMYFYRTLRKYGKENFQISLLCSCGNKEELDLMEDLYIALYNTLNSEVGYNCRRGGANGKFSDESKQRCSESKKGLKYKPRKVASLCGSDHPSFGRKAATEVRKKMSDSRKGDNSYKYRQDVSTEDLIHLYEIYTTTEIGKMFNIHPSTVGDRLSKAGVPTKDNSHYVGPKSRIFHQEVDTQELIRLYRSGRNSVELSKIFPLSPSSIGNRIKSTGEKMRPRFHV